MTSPEHLGATQEVRHVTNAEGAESFDPITAVRGVMNTLQALDERFTIMAPLLPGKKALRMEREILRTATFGLRGLESYAMREFDYREAAAQYEEAHKFVLGQTASLKAEITMIAREREELKVQLARANEALAMSRSERDEALAKLASPAEPERPGTPEGE